MFKLPGNITLKIAAVHRDMFDGVLGRFEEMTPLAAAPENFQDPCGNSPKLIGQTREGAWSGHAPSLGLGM